ncbi:MAG TPA: MFS transporter, partial [Paenalcaligenes sp.]|nr:MFS transporter [Paenalcaligenes sp.]
QERGLALGVYNTAQSLGVFFGAAAGGVMIRWQGPLGGFYISIVLVALWWLSTRRFKLEFA